MRIYSQADIIDALPYDLLTSALPKLLQAAVETPQRHVHTLKQASEPDATLLLMPAWAPGGLAGVKIVNVTPGNMARGLASVMASYLLFDAVTGEHLALLDGGEMTARRTAAVAAVAADKLAIDGAKSLLLVGSGRIAGELAFAYRAVRPIEVVQVYSPTQANAEKLAAHLNATGFKAQACSDLAAAIPQADIIAAATLSQSPLVLGESLRLGQHVALIGGFTPDMREADDAAVRRARVWVDTRTAMSEAGDLCVPLSRGVIGYDDIRGTLSDLCAGERVAGREGTITLFKSVGDAAQDLAAASIVIRA